MPGQPGLHHAKEEMGIHDIENLTNTNSDG